MLRTHIARLGVAVAAAALTIPALAPAAQAAPAPKVPKLAAVAKIYPHFAGGSVYQVRVDKVYGPGKKCDTSKRIKGAVGTTASYATADFDPSTGAEPSLTIVAYRVPSAAKAKALIRSYAASAKKCPAGGAVIMPGIKSTKVKSFKVKLGTTSQGFTITTKTDSGTYVNNMITVLKGKTLIGTLVGSTDGKVPSVKKSVKAAALAVTSAG